MIRGSGKISYLQRYMWAGLSRSKRMSALLVDRVAFLDKGLSVDVKTL